MFEYFSGNYAWNQTFAIAADSGNLSEMDNACRPLKEKAKENDAAAQEAWYESWKRLAEHVKGLAVHDEEAGYHLSAGQKYIRASNYYFIAERNLTNLDPRKLETYIQAISAFKKGIQFRREPVDWVEVPFQGSSMPALFIPALGGERAPCIIEFNGFDSLKELLYLHIGQEFRYRGMALLIVDHPGSGEALRLRNMPLEPKTEIPAAACVDYLESRSDIDPERIGIIGLSLGGYYAPRAAAFEKRLKCCVAWAASWNPGGRMKERYGQGQTAISSVPPFQLPWVFGKETVEEALKIAGTLTLEGIADKITCPLLVVHGENDQLSPVSEAEKTIEAAVNSPRRKLKVFTRAEGAAEHCQLDNVSMAVGYISDWVAEVLGGKPKGV